MQPVLRWTLPMLLLAQITGCGSDIGDPQLAGEPACAGKCDNLDPNEAEESAPQLIVAMQTLQLVEGWAQTSIDAELSERATRQLAMRWVDSTAATDEDLARSEIADRYHVGAESIALEHDAWGAFWGVRWTLGDEEWQDLFLSLPPPDAGGPRLAGGVNVPFAEGATHRVELALKQRRFNLPTQRATDRLDSAVSLVVGVHRVAAQAHAAALEALGQITLSESDPLALSVQGLSTLCLVELGDFTGAVDATTRMVERYPYNSEMLNLRAMARVGQARSIDKAVLDDLERSVALDAASAQTRDLLKSLWILALHQHNLDALWAIEALEAQLREPL